MFDPSPLIAGGLNFLGQERANSQNRHSAREQMRFQERMSSTAYQRTMKDMELAGLNPILAYSQGGASSPSGASSVSQSSLGAAVSSAQDAKRTTADVNNMKALNAKIKAETALTDSEIYNKRLLAESTAGTNHWQQLVLATQRLLNIASAKNLEADNAEKALQAEISGTKFGKVARYAERVLPFMRK